MGVLAVLTFHISALARLKKANKSLQGFLESERLRKETLLRENTGLHELKEAAMEAYDLRLKDLQLIVKRQDEDILLLQRSNEETEALLEAGLPELHNLKLQLIEANNTIARYKAQLERLAVAK